MQASKLSKRTPVPAVLEYWPEILDESPWKKDVPILLMVLVAHAFCFLPICFQVGFYLDDWLTFWNLHFAPHNFFDLLKASFSDPRMVTRPVQCFYYATTYLFFGDRPLPYHLVRFGLEYFGAVCLYFGIKRLSLSHFVGAVSALIFLLYPSHDASHYWIGGGLGPGFGLTLYLASFCCSMRAFTTKNKALYWAAIGFYGLSAFCYEAFLPMIVFSFCGVLLLSAEKRVDSRLVTMSSVVAWIIPFLLVGFLEPIYQRLLLPKVAHVFLSPSAFDFSYFCNVFVQGLNVSLFAGLWSFLAERVREALISFTPLHGIQIVGSVTASLAVLAFSYSNEQIRYRRLYTAAILTFFASYLTFAVAQGYTPVLGTMINRVNVGASVAVAVMLALSCKWLVDHMLISTRRAKACSALLGLPLILIMVLSNMALSSFWISSWNVQKNVRFLISKHSDQIKAGDCIILADTHRYLNWAPVFDGTWDFQSMLRMTLNTNSVSGGVVSDRLVVERDKVHDVSAAYVCASYPSDRITLFFPSESAWLPIKSSEDFIEQVKTRSKNIPMSAETLHSWSQGAARK